MKKYIDSIQLAELISKRFKGVLTEAESRRLEGWLNEDTAHMALFKNLKRKQEIARKMKEYEHYDSKKNWEMVRKRMSGGHRVLYFRLAAIAALFMVFLGSIYLFRFSEISVPETNIVIVAGGHKARLLLHDGSVVNLDTLTDLNLNGVKVAKTKNIGLAYVKDSVQQGVTGKMAYNQVLVPRGGEYDLMLEDGTRIWLNAETKLKFPVAFNGDERKVYLKGEAYFAVAKDAGRPFRVVVDEQTVEVLGTEFNVNAYEDEEQVYTTLVEGKVKVVTNNLKELCLLPSEQAVLNVKTGEIGKKEVDVNGFVSWKDGAFVFEDQTLEQILRKLARWYDFHVFYQSEELKQVVFEGSLRRYADFRDLLDLLERTGEVRFDVKGRTVTVIK